MLSLAAYAHRLSVRPGERIRFSASNATGAAVSARVERVICADANPRGPGIQTAAVSGELTTLRAPLAEVSPQGSYAVVDSFGAALKGPATAVLCRVYPTIATGKRQVLLSALDESEKRGFSLDLDSDGAVSARVGTGNAIVTSESGPVLALRRWHAVWLSVDGSNAVVGCAHINDPMVSDEPMELAFALGGPAEPPGGHTPLVMAAAIADGVAAEHFTGKLEAPVIIERGLAATDRSRYLQAQAPVPVLAAWDYAQQVGTRRVVDVGPGELHGRTVNSPARGMTGSSWDGSEMRYSHAPWMYGAIHFHADDLDDCEWPACFEWTPPGDAPSGVYALFLEAGGEVENVPFYVVPPKGKRTADIAVLASTFTYTIYANHARFEWGEDPSFSRDWRAQAAAWNAYPHNAGDHREYALSTYNDHLDGSGISIASWHRPMLNVRVGFITYPYEEIRASGLRHFPADTHLTAWLEAKGYDFDIVTDWELHTEGVELLQDYRVVMTGSHPEYHSPNMLNALQAYRDQGGRLCYMGGNGFYWKIAVDEEREGIIEIRRGEGGIRAWAAEPGEYYNQFDGEYGGMWRRNGRPPQNLCGVGFSAQGNFSGSYYRKTEAAADPRVSWMFLGIDDPVIGDHGFSGHGAAGFELDRADKKLGTPRHAIVVASSEDHPPETPWVVVPEEILTHLATLPGEPAADLIRADMTFFEGPNGGAVFSTGSITFCGSLMTNGFDNDISNLVGNVLERFLDPMPFEMPA